MTIKNSKFFIIITARKRSLGQGNVFTNVCHSVHRGVMMSLPVWLSGPVFLLGGGLCPGGGGSLKGDPPIYKGG